MSEGADKTEAEESKNAESKNAESKNVANASKSNGFLCIPPKFIWVAAIAFASFGSTFVFGYCISVLNSPKQKIECFFLESWLNDFTLKSGANGTITKAELLAQCPTIESLTSYLSESDDTKLRWMYTMTQAVWAMALAVGGMCTGVIVDKFGRRNSLIAANSLSILASVIILPSMAFKTPWLIYVVRVLTGFHNGLTIPMQSMYATEIAPLRWRGAAGSCGQLFITIGIAIGGLVGLEQLLNREKLWVIAVALSGIPSLISSLILPFMPESPRFLFINLNEKQAAEEAVRSCCDEEDARKTIEDLHKEVATASKDDGDSSSVLELLTKPKFRLAIILGLVMVSVQQLSGINVVMQYSTIMLENAGAPRNIVPFITLGLYVVNVLATVASMFTMDKFGRRTLFLASLATVLLGLVCIFVFMFFAPTDSAAAKTATAGQRIASGFVCCFTFVFVVGFAIGLGSVTVMYISEIFQQRQRGAANSLCIATQQTCNLLVILSFYNIEKLLKSFVYLIYVVPVAFGIVFCFMFMPETKNRSVTEVADELANKKI